MQITLPRKLLHTGLASVTRAVTGRSSLPILGNVLLEAVGGTLRLLGTDLEIAISRILDGVDVKTPGALCLPAKSLTELVAGLPDADVTLVACGNSGALTCGKSSYTLHGLTPVEFPPAPELTEAKCLSFGTDILRRGLSRTLPCVSRDDTRPVLTGVLIEVRDGELRFVSTDTHRLALDKSAAPSAARVSAIVPARAMRELVPLLGDADTCECRFGENQASFAIGGTTVSTRLIEGQFPKYERVIPAEHTCWFDLDAGELKRAVKRAGVVAREDANRLGFTVEGLTLTVSASAGSLGECREEVTLQDGSGDLPPFYLNSAYLLDALDAIGGDRVVFQGTQPLAPFVLRHPVDTSGLLVVMPMQPAGG